MIQKAKTEENVRGLVQEVQYFLENGERERERLRADYISQSPNSKPNSPYMVLIK